MQSSGYPPFTLALINDLDWNYDMASWDNLSAFKIHSLNSGTEVRTIICSSVLARNCRVFAWLGCFSCMPCTGAIRSSV